MTDRRRWVDFTGKVAAVTGGGKGFGSTIAKAFADRGAVLAIIDLSADAARRSAGEIGARGGRAASFAADVGDADGVAAAFDAIRGTLGPVDILVNNAGIVSSTPFLRLDASEWERVQGVDYTGVFNCCRAVIPDMKARGSGRIVNIGSVAGARGGGFLGTAAYAAAKAGVAGLTAALAEELAPFGILVNAVAPGSMNTEMTQPLRDKPELFARVLAGIPMGRQGEAEHVADAVTFLASDLAASVSGETLHVDGGVTMK